MSDMPDASDEEIGRGAMDVVENMGLDLTKEEKLRTTALMLACRFYVEKICRDPEMYRELVRNGKELSPASARECARDAQQFYHFIKYGDVKQLEDGSNEVPERPAPSEAA